MTLRLGGTAVGRLLVIGFGVTGRAVCEYVRAHGASVFVSEQRPLSDEERAWLGGRGIGHEEGGHTESALTGVDAVVLSPGVPLSLPLVERATQSRIPVYSELDVASLVCAARPIVAVTGTNGKSSTVTLIGELLRFWGREAPVVGNIGLPFIDASDRVASADAIVIEASSYQLEQSIVFHPQVGVLLNLEPDHLARHKTMDAYAAAKGRLFRLQTSEDVAVLPRTLAPRFPEGRGRRVFYDDARLALPQGAERLSPHQRDNLRAALCACEALLPGIDRREAPMERIVASLRLPHRMEPVGFVRGVRVVDDSKSTNPASTLAALASVEGPVVLLLGGRSKGAGYDILRAAIARRPIRRTVLFGEAAEELAGLLGGLPIDCAADVEAAIAAGLRVARPGDTLLFSPGCSSFDQFGSFEERGRAFAGAVRACSGFSFT